MSNNINNNNYAIGKYAWGNKGGFESSLVEFERKYLDPFIMPYVKGYTLNDGCGPDLRGDVRLDIEETEATTIVGDSCKLPFEDGEFDTVMLIGVLHHIPDYKKAIKEACRVSKGLVIGREPNILNPQLCTIRYKLGLGGECPLYIPSVNKEFEADGFLLQRERWDYGLKLIGTILKKHELMYKLDSIVPEKLRAFWSYVYVRQ